MFGAVYDSFFYDGIFLTIIGQPTFIAAYAMLVFISRLRRFDPALDRDLCHPGGKDLDQSTGIGDRVTKQIPTYDSADNRLACGHR